MPETNAVVAVYRTHEAAEEGIRELQRAGTDMQTLSIIGKDTHTDEQVVGYYNNGDRMKYWGKTGAFWGGFWGLLFGSAFFAIPGIGPVLGGLSAIGAGLIGMGIPKDSVVEYELALKTGKYLLMLSGTAAEVDKARAILEGTRPIDTAVHTSEAVGAGVGSF
jgi:uncharacterized membrane protein